MLILSDSRRVPIKVLLNVDDSRHMFEKKYNRCKCDNSILLKCLKDIYNKLNVNILDDEFSNMEAIKVAQSKALNRNQTRVKYLFLMCLRMKPT